MPNRTDLGQIKPEELNETDVASQNDFPLKNLDEISKNKRNYTLDELPNNLDEIIESQKFGEKAHTEEAEFISNVQKAWIKGYEGDPCPNCGAFTLIRNGTCMKCDTCGGTTGCS